MNTVYWESELLNVSLQKYNSLENTHYQIIFYEVEAKWADNCFWGYVDADIDSATFVFKQVPRDTVYYHLRYYVQDTESKEYRLSKWSNPVWSVQDIYPPIINFVSISKLETSNDRYWANGNLLEIHLSALDSIPGRLNKIIIKENSKKREEISLSSKPQYIDTTFQYMLKSSMKNSIDFLIELMDCSGQTAQYCKQPLYWLPLNEEKDEPYCFPNPVNLDENTATIKYSNTTYNKAVIVDIFGNFVKEIKRNKNEVLFKWDGRNFRRQKVSTGGYIFYIEGNKNIWCKIAVIN